MHEPGKGFLESIFHQGSLAFPEDSVQKLLSIFKSKPTIVSIYIDRAAVIPEIAENASALIGHFGTSDEALLELIFGIVEPSGKLPLELPSSLEAVIQQKEDMPYDSKDPLFPFGYGLTYKALNDSTETDL